MAKSEKEHPIVIEYKEAFDISERYTSKLTADILEKGWVGKKVNEKTIDDVVDFLHSKEVAGMMKTALGAKGKDFSPEEILSRYGLPKHMIKEALSEYESITPDVLLSLVQQLAARLHGELVSHHPASLANLAYEKGDEAAKKVLKDLYTVSGGEKYAANNEKTIENLLGPDKILDHLQGLYQRRELQGKMAENSEKIRKPVDNIIDFPEPAYAQGKEKKQYKRTGTHG